MGGKQVFFCLFPKIDKTGEITSLADKSLIKMGGFFHIQVMKEINTKGVEELLALHVKHCGISQF